MRYVLIDEKRIITNIIEIEPMQAAAFAAHYLGRTPLEIGDTYPEIDITTETEPPVVPDGVGIGTIRKHKLAELSQACRTAIIAGCDVTLTDGTVEHFALEETDQINLTAAVTACQQGAAEYPYHADGQLCRLYSAADIIAIGDAATTHKLWHTTRCNHMMMWARRAETAEELAGIVYGAELPADLAANMESVLGGVESG